MGIGIGRLLPWEMGFKPLGLEFGLGMEKSVKNEIWEWDLNTAKWNFENKRAGKCYWYSLPPSGFLLKIQVQNILKYTRIQAVV